LVIAISSRALFDFEKENKIYKNKGETDYMKAQLRHLETSAPIGVAFPMIRKLLAFNQFSESPLVEVVVLSRNDPTTGLRVFRSIKDHGLGIACGVFTRGKPSLPYLSALGAHLFLSALKEDVKAAIDGGFPAAHVMGGNDGDGENDEILRIAFDGDAVLFGDESEKIYQEKGLATFAKQEGKMAKAPLSPGPLKPFLDALHRLRRRLPEGKIRTALVTSRGAPAHERPIRTLMKWRVDIDEAFFLGGRKKIKFLQGFRPDFFFDDQVHHLQGNRRSGHVEYGITNQTKNMTLSA
jgi:5'-nucleotidase